VPAVLAFVRIKKFRKLIPNRAAQPLINDYILTYIATLQSQNVHRLQLGQRGLLARLSLLNNAFFQTSVHTMETSVGGWCGYFNDVLRTNLVKTTGKLVKCNNKQVLQYILRTTVNLYTHWRRRRHTLPTSIFLS
jgi:hypothetical protein